MQYKMITRSISFYSIRDWYGGLVKPKQIKPPYKHVVQIGDPILRQRAENVRSEFIGTTEFNEIIARMKEVFEKYNSCGLSAPQIGIPLNILIFGITKKHFSQYSLEEIKTKEIQLENTQIIVNPQMKITDFTKVIFPESCESVRGFWADVPRYQALQLSGITEAGHDISLTLKGWTARVVQHEMDHLHGKLYTDIMERKTFTCGCWEVINQRNGGVILPYRPR